MIRKIPSGYFTQGNFRGIVNHPSIVPLFCLPSRFCSSEGKTSEQSGSKSIAKRVIDKTNGKIYLELSDKERLPSTIWKQVHATLKPNDFLWIPKDRRWSADISPVSQEGALEAEKFLSEIQNRIQEIHGEEKDEANSNWIDSEDRFLKENYPDEFEKITKAVNEDFGSRENLTQYIDKVLEEAKSFIPKGINKERLLTNLREAMEEIDLLLELEPRSVQKTILTSAALGLSPDPISRECYYITFKEKLVFISGYRGLMELAGRSGDVLFFDARCVYKNDAFELKDKNGLEIWHVPHRDPKSRGEISSIYAFRLLKNGEKDYALMSQEDLNKFLKRSKNTNKVWTEWNEEMSTKALIKLLIKKGELSLEKKPWSNK